MSGQGETTEAVKSNVRELRKSRRKKSFLPATLVTEAGSWDCHVLDLSRGGAQVATSVAVSDEQAVTLIVKPIGTFAGLVAWRADGRFGVKFLAQHGTAGVGQAASAAGMSPAAASRTIAAEDGGAASKPHKTDPPHPPSAPAAETKESGETNRPARSRKLRPPPAERAITLHRGDLICVLRKKSEQTDVQANGGSDFGRGETLRVKDLAGCELVELDPRNFMSLLEQQSAFSIALMRVSSGGTEKRPQGSVGAEDKTEGGEKRATSAAAVA